jgi:hypothetical protein
MALAKCSSAFEIAVRDVERADYAAIAAMHAEMQMDYRLPDLDSPLFLVRKLATDAEGRVLGCCLLRLTTEAYLILDPEISAPQKMKMMEALQPEVLDSAWRKGIDDIEARIPETVERKFRKRLLQLGWLPCRSGWNPWSRETR